MDASTQELMQGRDGCKTIREYQKYTMVLLHKELGLSIEQVSKFFGYSVSSFYRVRNELAAAALNLRPTKVWGGRRKSYLSSEEELELIKELEKAAKKGKFVDIKIIKAKLQDRIGHPVHKTSIYRFLERHNWRKVAPRKYHPNRNLAAQEAFKKSSQNLSKK